MKSIWNSFTDDNGSGIATLTLVLSFFVFLMFLSFDKRDTNDESREFGISMNNPLSSWYNKANWPSIAKLHPISCNKPFKRSPGQGVSDGLNFRRPLYKNFSAFASLKTPFSEIKSLKPSSSSTVSIINLFSSPTSPISKSLSPSSSPSFSSTIPFKLILPNFVFP